jgi:hypothetical protein
VRERAAGCSGRAGAIRRGSKSTRGWRRSVCNSAIGLRQRLTRGGGTACRCQASTEGVAGVKCTSFGAGADRVLSVVEEGYNFITRGSEANGVTDQ